MALLHIAQHAIHEWTNEEAVNVVYDWNPIDCAP